MENSTYACLYFLKLKYNKILDNDIMMYVPTSPSRHVYASFRCMGAQGRKAIIYYTLMHGGATRGRG
jgi:hypothetical protein